MWKRFPTTTQLDSSDCGPACLKIVAQYYGKEYSLHYLKNLCRFTKEGVSLLNITQIAQGIGFQCKGVELNFDQLKNKVTLPCIIHWNQNHYVVVYKIRKISKRFYIYISDPSLGLLKYDQDHFLKHWTSTQPENKSINKFGIALLLSPTDTFYQKEKAKKHKTTAKEIFHFLHAYRQYLCQLLLAILTGSLVNLMLPFIAQAIIDIGIGNQNIDFVIVMLILQIALIIGQMGNELIRSWLMLHMTTRISISLIYNFLAKLLLLPISFFDTKTIGDIMQRVEDHGRIQSFLTGSLISIMLATITFIIYSIIMTSYSWKIFTIFAIGSILYIVWVLLFMKKRKRIDYLRFQEASANQSNIIQLISAVQEIKLYGCEKTKLYEWMRIQVKLFNINIKGLALGQILRVGGTFIDQAKNLIISFLSARAVIDGEMSFGMMIALQYVLGQLNAPIAQFLTFIQDAQDAKISSQRAEEIYNSEKEVREDINYISKIPQNADIEFKNVDFRYNERFSENVLNQITIKIPHGKVTAIVGSSGSGKTTLMKMMLGFYKPNSGEILLGGKNICDYNPVVWRNECGIVLQNGFIFSDTIANNINLSGDKLNIEKLKDAIKISNIDELINKMPHEYNTKVGLDGNNLSGGQKQRLLIARAAYKNSRYLFLDEATNSLDALTEDSIMSNLSTLFKNKTVVIIAHRLSTVKNADNIIVLDKGRVIEEGTHSFLIEKKGYYYNLIKNQLDMCN